MRSFPIGVGRGPTACIPEISSPSPPWASARSRALLRMSSQAYRAHRRLEQCNVTPAQFFAGSQCGKFGAEGLFPRMEKSPMKRHTAAIVGAAILSTTLGASVALSQQSESPPGKADEKVCLQANRMMNYDIIDERTL